MKPEHFESILRQTLDDRRLSRAERRAVREVIADWVPSDDTLAHCRSQAFDLARAALAEAPTTIERGKIVDWLEDVVKLLIPTDDEPPVSEAHFSPGDRCLKRITALLRAAQRSVDICVFTITDDRIAQCILDCHRRGVALRVLTDNEKVFDKGSDIDRLEAAGIPVRVDRTHHHMHHKFAIFDGEVVLTGSYNWTRSAAAHNHENLVVSNDPRLARAFSRIFEEVWAEMA